MKKLTPVEKEEYDKMYTKLSAELIGGRIRYQYVNKVTREEANQVFKEEIIKSDLNLGVKMLFFEILGITVTEKDWETV